MTDHRHEQDFTTAQARTCYKVGDVIFEHTAFACAPDQVIVLHISASKPGELNATICLDGPLIKSIEALGDNRLLLTGKASKHVSGAGYPESEKPVVLPDVLGEGMRFAA